MKVCLDAGHGGADSGAVGPDGLLEKDVALAVALRLGRYLVGKGIEVVQTRRTDKFLSLSGRAAIANNSQVDCLVSIHANAAHGAARGFECFTSRGATRADALAAELLGAYEDAFPGVTNRGLKESGFTILTRTRAPAALFELDFIDHPDGEALLADEANRAVMTRALGIGVLRWLGVDPVEPAPDPLRARLVRLRHDLDEIISSL